MYVTAELEKVNRRFEEERKKREMLQKENEALKYQVLSLEKRVQILEMVLDKD
jgi:hypothetical protein